MNKEEIIKYLDGLLQLESSNQFYSSQNYLMTKPKAGKEKEFEEAKRNIMIVETLIELVETIPLNNGK